MPTLAEVLRQLWGAWRLARGDTKGVAVFGDDVRAFWQSFTAAGIVLPLFFVMLWLMPGWAGDGGEGRPARFWLAELATYANLWVAFPFVMLPLARAMQREHRYIRFICAYNWSSVLQSALQCFILVLAGGGLLPPEGEQLLSLIAFVAILLYAWFVAKTALEVTPLQAVGVVFLDFVIGTVVQAVGEGLKLA